MCKIFKTCWLRKKEKNHFTGRLTIIEFKKKLKPIDTKVSKYSNIAKKKQKYGEFLILCI
tara:strand:- start:16 stop:195 length:180 start_codon:yes stop_codon:yes gene_type:complete